MFGNLFSKKQIQQVHTPSPTRGRDAFDIHLDLTWKIEATYKKRNTDSSAIEKTVELCKQQIALAPKAKSAWVKENQEIGAALDILPMHKGYEQLCILYEKQGGFDAVIALAEKLSEKDGLVSGARGLIGLKRN